METEYRAWDGESIIIPKYLCQMDTLVMPYPDFVNEETYPKSMPVILIQYTGLKDKNGNKIFNGDIVKYIDYDDVIHTSEVKYEDGCFVVWSLDDSAFGSVPYLKNFKVEIIGNIYQNKELLNND